MQTRTSTGATAGRAAATGRGGFRSVVLGVDDSSHSRRAAAFLARLVPGARGRVTAIRVLEPMRPPSLALLPAAVRDRIAHEFAQEERAARAQAQRSLAATARDLAAGGWRVDTVVRVGIPLTELLDAVRREGADLLVLGARGASGLERLILGSTAEGALKRAAVPVLIVK